MTDKAPTVEAIAAMKAAPGHPAEQQLRTAKAGNGQEAPDVFHEARSLAQAIEQTAEDADHVARLYRQECQRIADEYRRITEAFLVRLIGKRN